ncbi:hypothetical protein FBULB1_2177 [Fusarium bulbicola]|nr:hypothetical protein FBULB1_2177 [Fusarium bulbicola]
MDTPVILQVRFRKDHLEGYVLINLPHYDPIRALEAAMPAVNDFDITTLNKPHGSNSSGWMSLTEHPSCNATALSAGVQFALPLAALRGNHNQTRLVPPAGMQQDNHQHIVAPTLKALPVGVKGTKRTRPEDDGDEQPSPKRPDTQGLSR